MILLAAFGSLADGYQTGMKGKLTLLVGAAVGYVAGTAAGRQRYEQLKSAARRTAENPKVQEKASEVQHKVAEAASKVTHAAAEKVRGSDDETTEPSPPVTSTGYPLE